MGSKHPTSDSSPTPPNPLAPPGAGEPNSRIWPTLFIDDVHAVRTVATRRARGFVASGQSVGTSYVQSVGHIRLLAPLSAPAGVERGGGDRGGNKLLSGIYVGGPKPLSWVRRAGAWAWGTPPLHRREGKN
jgi:hypothetical protein